MSPETLHIFFARPPLIGQCKTRLARYLGDAATLELYTRMLDKQFQNFKSAKIPFEIHSATADRMDLLQKLAKTKNVYPQIDGDLGQRMASAFQLANGNDPAADLLLGGTDIPGYTPEIARIAIKILTSHDAVLGPTLDGGYYLIGLKERHAHNPEILAKIFHNSRWSHPGVLQEQLQRLSGIGLSVGLAPELEDIDDAPALMRWRRTDGFENEDLIPDVRVILPILNEKENLEFVLSPLLASGYFNEVICADNGSTDGSPELAKQLGAHITLCKQKGYGATCLKALDNIRERGGCDVVLFMDGDGADHPSNILDVLAPVASNRYDVCLGARVMRLAAPGSLLPHQRFGNWMITRAIQFIYGHRYLDLGPFRAIRWQALENLHMDDRNFGWTVQLQIRALQAGLRIIEIPVAYRKRHAGYSKVTATIKGSLLAAKVILSTVLKERLFPRIKDS